MKGLVSSKTINTYAKKQPPRRQRAALRGGGCWNENLVFIIFNNVQEFYNLEQEKIAEIYK
ncbi:hypothetical protein JCM14036_08750 [Desulfotomaculum defluvii]